MCLDFLKILWFFSWLVMPSVGRCATSLKLASLDFFPFPENLWEVDLWQVYYVFYSITFVLQNTDPT